MTFLPTIYPSGISRAVSAIDEIPAFKALPDGFLRVIVRIVKKINLRSPSNPIVASRNTLAVESGKSVETVHRAIRWLEELGLIERAQKARAGLRGSSSPLMPTHKLLEALLLIPEVEAQLKKAKHVAPASPIPARDFVRVNGLTLPSDLAWIVQQGRAACLCRAAVDAHSQGVAAASLGCRRRHQAIPEAAQGAKPFFLPAQAIGKRAGFHLVGRQAQRTTPGRTIAATSSAQGAGHGGPKIPES